jgi:hypothetical protein
MSYDNTNSGMLAKNDNKQSDNHPDYKGSINVDGVEYWLSGWIKEGKPGGKMEGRKFFSLSVQPKEAKAPAKPARQSRPSRDEDESIPF